MKFTARKKIATALMASMAAFSGAANAESVLDTTAAFSAAARHDFIVVIPAFLFFGVGPGATTLPLATNTAVGSITFSPAAGAVGDGNAVAGTGGDASASAANVRLIGNNGQVTITATNDGGGNGLGTGTPADGFIPLTQISTVASNAALPAPALTDAGGTTSLPTVTGKVTNLSGTWTYSYLNTVTPAAGTYGGLGRGRVTYTATMP